ncbi:ArnT family glycosyltransferase [Rhizobium paknamense]|uniref:4-amino-4-deoxy-L-arabinose transferase-like glycosyltransferase n=1 Tax=Rhizobium paknamense TaxID=1206817 RepID=A0ABU0IAH1_9HYPH|nr:glycosyltransferase family 39 protein [Rhizobium paknamense]MDQ0454224.1 4-amino-4-deoxy-L-arabinose transferase-like glycosyltransferase [Rhizobium paknamense]
MIAALRQRSSSLLLLLGAYFLLNMLVRLSLPASLELDEGQQLYYAQFLSLGYDSQPPFYNWIQYGVVELLGPSLLSLTLLKNLMLFTSYALMAATGFTLLKSRDLAVIATLAILTMPQVSFEAQRDLTHTVALIFSTALFFFALIRTLKQPSLGFYALTGLAIGIGTISKYNFVLIPLATLIALSLEPAFRRRLFDWRLLVTLAIAVAVVLPHGLWFLDHMEEATRNTIGKMTDEKLKTLTGQIAVGLRSLTAATLASAALTVLLLLIPFGKGVRQTLKSGNEWSRLLGRSMAFVVVMLALMVIFGGVSFIKDRWLAPSFLMLPLYIALKVEASGHWPEKALNRFLPVALVIMVLVPLALTLRVFLAGTYIEYQKQSVPYARAITAMLKSMPERPGFVLTSDQQLAGNVRLSAPDLPVGVAPGSAMMPQPLSPDRPVMLIWRDKGRPEPELPQPMRDWVNSQPGLSQQSVGQISLPYLYGKQGDLYHFSYAVYGR